MHKRFKNLLLLTYCIKFINLDKVYFLIFFRFLYEGMILNLKFFELQPYNTSKNREDQNCIKVDLMKYII